MAGNEGYMPRSIGRGARSESIAMYQYVGVKVHTAQECLENNTKVLVNSKLKLEHDMSG
jgi:hypothetical protein